MILVAVVAQRASGGRHGVGDDYAGSIGGLRVWGPSISPMLRIGIA
jgi:hypothetical protein